MPVTTYTVIEGEVVSQNQNGTIHDFLPDPLGHTLALIASDGSIEFEWDYFPYEQVPTVWDSATPFRYGGTRGYYSDIYSRPHVGERELRTIFSCWMQVDPMWPSEGAYSYVGNKPITVTDPSGTRAELEPAGKLGGGPQEGRTGKCAIFVCYQYGFGFPSPLPTHSYVCVTGPHGGCALGLYPDGVGDQTMPCKSVTKPFPIHCDEVTNRTPEDVKCELANAVCECIRIKGRKPPSYLGSGTCLGFSKSVLGCAIDRLEGSAKVEMMTIVLYRA